MTACNTAINAITIKCNLWKQIYSKPFQMRFTKQYFCFHIIKGNLERTLRQRLAENWNFCTRLNVIEYIVCLRCACIGRHSKFAVISGECCYYCWWKKLTGRHVAIKERQCLQLSLLRNRQPMEQYMSMWQNVVTIYNLRSGYSWILKMQHHVLSK